MNGYLLIYFVYKGSDKYYCIETKKTHKSKLKVDIISTIAFVLGYWHCVLHGSIMKITTLLVLHLKILYICAKSISFAENRHNFV